MTHKPIPRLQMFPDREGWLEARRSGVGGSDAPVILGLSKWASPLSLWMRKVGLSEDQEESEAMRWGSLIEPIIVGELARETGLAITHFDNAIVSHPTYAGLFCSPDGFADDGTLVEAKTTNAFRAHEWDEGPPEVYMAQVQHSLACCPEAPRALIAVLIGGQVFRWCWVDRDPTWEERCAPALLEFVRRLREEDPPPTTGHEKDDEAISAYFGHEAEGLIYPLPVEALDWHEELLALGEQKKALEDRVRELKTMLKEKIGTAQYGLLPGNVGAYRWETEERKGYVVKPSSSRILRFVKKMKEGSTDA